MPVCACLSVRRLRQSRAGFLRKPPCKSLALGAVARLWVFTSESRATTARSVAAECSQQSLGAIDESGDAVRLSVLFRAWGSPEDDQLTPYGWSRFDRANALRAARMLDDALETVDAPPAARRELAWRAGTSFPTLITLAAALDPGRSGWRRWWRQWQRQPSALEHPRPLLTGVEVAEIAGIEPGPELGRIAHALLRAQVRGEVRSRGGARRWIRKSSPR